MRAAFTVSLLIACGAFDANAAEKPKYGGEIRIPMTTDITSFDPARCYINPGINIVRLCYTGLVGYDEQTTIVPRLATNWEIRDGTNYIFHLDPIARFPNGRVITTSDYIYSFERTFSGTINCPGGFLYSGVVGLDDYRTGKTNRISGVTANGDFELQIQLQQIDATFLYKMAMPFVAPVCREIAHPLGDRLDAVSAGAGPMHLTEYKRGAEMLLERNAFMNPRVDVYVDRVRVFIGSTETVHEMMFENGEVEIANLYQGIAGTQVARVRRTPRLAANLTRAPYGNIFFVALNCELPPFDNKLIRKAFNYGINKQRISEKSHDTLIPIAGLIPPSLPDFNTNLVGYTFSPDKARALVREAGYPNGCSATMWVANDTDWLLSSAQMMQRDLAEVGINIEIKIVTAPTLIEGAGTRKKVQCSMSGWLQDYPDQSTFFELLRGANISDKDSQNLSFYKNDKVDRLLDEAARMLDAGRRRELYREAEEIVVDDAPMYFWTSPWQFCMRQPWLKGPMIHPVWVFAFDQMWIDR